MHMSRSAIFRLAVGFVCFATVLSSGWAREVSLERAVATAERWRKSPGTHLTEALAGKQIDAAETVYDETDSTPLFHVVNLEAGGFVVMAADDGVEPVVAFSGSGAFDAQEGGPLQAWLKRDMRARLEAGVAQAMTRHVEAWEELQAPVMMGLETEALDDVRVAPLVQSQWGQGASDGMNVFNRFTPNGYPCGCVAVAGAQIMRYHEYPASVAASEQAVFVDGVKTVMSIPGGTYDWANMRLAGPFSVTEAEAIGRLCADAGAASRTSYAADGSGAYSATLAEGLTSVFGFANAKTVFGSAAQGTLLADAILANLDAGFPVSLGILEEDSRGNLVNGHQVLGDGYGYYGGTLYVHMNMGWSGNSDVWYNLAEIDTERGYTFTVVDDVVFNVFPESTGEIVSGRVLNASGNPLAGITVELSDGQSCVSDANGIFAAIVGQAQEVVVRAAAEGLFAEARATTGQSTSTRYTYNSTTGALTYTPGTGTCGNRRVELRLAEAVHVVFDAQGGTLVDNERMFALGAPYGTLPTPLLAGQTFTGWYTADGTRIVAASIVSDTVTQLFARWSSAYGAALNPDLTWTSGGDAQWIMVTDVTSDGLAAMRSGDMPSSIFSSESCWIQTTVTGPGTLQFAWRATSDSLTFAVDGATTATLSGSASSAWSRKNYSIAAGTHTLSWTFTRPLLFPGNGHGWLDEVSWTPTVMQLASTEKTFDYTGGADSLGVAANVAWSVSSSASWITLENYSGNLDGAVRFSVAPNTTTARRSGTLTVTGGGASQTCAIVQNPRQVTVLFDAQGGSVQPVSALLAVGATYGVLPVPVRDGFAFAGWFTAPDGGGELVTSSTLARETITQLYALWAQDIRDVAVTFNASPGSVSPSTRTYSVGQQFKSFPVPTRSGYAFAGWFTQAGDRVWENTRVDASVASMTLTAKWVATGSLANALNPLLPWTFTDEDNRWTIATGSTSSQDGTGVRTRNGKKGEVLTAQTTVTGPGIMTFYWKRASTASADTLIFSANGTTHFTKTTTSWTSAQLTCSAGEKVCRWTYTHGNSDSNNFYFDMVVWTPTLMTLTPSTKSFSASAGNATASVESNAAEWTAQSEVEWITLTAGASGALNGNVAYVVAENTSYESRTGRIKVSGAGAVEYITIFQNAAVQTVSLEEALDASLAFETSGNALWFGQVVDSSDGEDAAQSGSLNAGGSSTLNVALDGPGWLRFMWRADSTHASDTLTFTRGGAPLATLSGSTDWQPFACIVGSAGQPFSWTYTRDSASANPDARGLLDRVEFFPLANAPDTDGDGMNDVAEWMAGTDPEDPADCLLASTCDLCTDTDGNPALRIQWFAKAGRTYQVLTADAPGATWRNAPDHAVAGGQTRLTAAEDTTLTCVIPLSGSSGFFRISLVLE